MAFIATIQNLSGVIILRGNEMKKYRVFISSEGNKKQDIISGYHYQAFASSLKEAFEKAETLCKNHPDIIFLMPQIRKQLKASWLSEEYPTSIGHFQNKRNGIYIQKFEL